MNVLESGTKTLWNFYVRFRKRQHRPEQCILNSKLECLLLRMKILIFLATFWSSLSVSQGKKCFYGLQKLSLQFERIFLLSFHIKLRSYLCNGVNIVLLNSRNTPKNSKNITQKQPFLTISCLLKMVITIRTTVSTAISQHIRFLDVQWDQSRTAWIQET